jgi:DNA-binding response OmpR family regulator
MSGDSGKTNDGGGSFLVVEDQEEQRDLLREVLGRWGYACDCATDCDSARSMFRPGAYACTLIDIGLPDGSGVDLLTEFSQFDQHLVQIVLTGDSSPDTIITTMRASAFDYLTKPVELATLKASVNRALAHHEVMRERTELFELLLQEREHLRGRVEAATADIRRRNEQLQALLGVMQSCDSSYSRERVLLTVYQGLKEAMPLRALALVDIGRDRGYAVLEQEDGELYSLDASTAPEGSLDSDLVGLGSDPEPFIANWLAAQAGFDVAGLRTLSSSQSFWNRSTYVVSFYLDPHEEAGEAVDELVSMCANFVAYEWEQAKTLLHMAHFVSIGNIAVELARNFVQPLTAIGIATDLIHEVDGSPDVQRGMQVIHENVERLQSQTQEFRRRVTVERHFETKGECVLLNGTVLARSFLDLLLASLRSVPMGGRLKLRLYDAPPDHIYFDISHPDPASLPAGLSEPSIFLSPRSGTQAHPGLQLAERAVHSCGGTLSTPNADEGGCIRIALPKNAASTHLAAGLAR